MTPGEIDNLAFRALQRAVVGGACAAPPPPEHACAAERHGARAGVGGLVRDGLRAMGVSDQPAWRAADIRDRAKLVVLQDTRERLGRSLERRGVAHLFLKGVLHDPAFYGGRGMRSATDIDVLIDGDGYRAAASALAELGYERLLFPAHLATELASKERQFRSPTRPRVDLHVGLLNAPPFRDFAPQALARRVLWQTSCGSIPGLTSEDVLVHMAGNLGQDRFTGRLPLFVDTAALLMMRRVNATVVVERARRAGCGGALWALLEAVRARFGVALSPTAAVTSLTPSRPMRAVLARLAGVRRPPPRVGPRLSLLAYDWPLSARTAWPLEATTRWALLRTRDLRARRRRARRRA